MQFGHFDDENREYVINTPHTPYPWINYLGTEDFFSLISHTAGGYCFYKDASLRRILRYRYNSIPLDMGGRCFYICENNTIWSPSFKPAMTELASFSCSHGLGYSRIKGMLNGLSTESLFFVPRGFNCEIHRLTLENFTQQKKDFKLFSFVEFCLWNALDDATNFQRNLSTGEIEVDGSVIYHITEYRERRNHFSFYSANLPIDGYDTDRETFFGPSGEFRRPKAVTEGRSYNSHAHGWSPVASHSISLSLEPGEKKNIVFVLGYIENPAVSKWSKSGRINKAYATEMVDHFSTSESVDIAFKDLFEYWDDLLLNFSVKSDDSRLDRMVNIWNQYQCFVTFNIARSASYFESGISRGIGFRDSNQDQLGFVHLDPESVKLRLIDLASTQFEDGSVYHQYQPLTKKGNDLIGRNFNDDPLWLILAVSAYIKETGDWSILDEQIPFDNNPQNTDTLFEHCKKSFYYIVSNTGPHGLPLIGRADWNDCLNLNCFSETPDASFQTCTNKDGKTAESIMIAGLFVYSGNDFLEMCRKKEDDDLCQDVKKHISSMVDSVKKHGWDGEWFLRAYDNFGDKIGSKENEEGRIFIESQGFCGMAGIGLDEGYITKSLRSVKEYLDTPYGIVLLNPAFSCYRLNLGEISTYPPGYKENAGVFCHNNPWIIISETIIGNGNQAFKYFKKITPAFGEDHGDLHKVEPYVYAQMIAGKDAKRHGEAKNSWLTGTASWCFVAITQWILGIRPVWNGLMVDPCIPKEWEGFSVKRRFRNSIYNISVKNPQNVSKGINSITVDGKEISGNILPVFSDGTHDVIVEMG